MTAAQPSVKSGTRTVEEIAMFKMLSVLAAVFVVLMAALPAAADAAQRRTDGIRNPGQIELSARRYVRRYHRRYRRPYRYRRYSYRRRYYGPYYRRYYYYRPYYCYRPYYYRGLFPLFW
jgi:hypothetical protein